MGSLQCCRLAILLLCAVLSLSPINAFADDQALLPKGCELAQPRGNSNQVAIVDQFAFPPIALQVRATVVPTMFASNDKNFLAYELQLQNFSSEVLTLRSIDIVDADQATSYTIAKYHGNALTSILSPAGIDNDDEQRSLLRARQGITAFLCVAFQNKEMMPKTLRHRITLDNGTVLSAVMTAHEKKLAVISRPLLGANWLPLHGPHIDSHHRRGLWLHEGVVENSRRFAIDWRKTKDGAWFTGDARDVQAYFSYGEKVLAVADGVVVRVENNFPDNIPRTPAGFTPAIEMTMNSVAGNVIVIDIGNGQFASYAHLQPGSVLVKVGDIVKRGQWIAKVGNSGDSRTPHLHFQLSTNSQHLLFGEGLPFVISEFKSKKVNQDWMTQMNTYPWGDSTLIDFGQ